jgi:FkbM family methyltransferase
MPGFCSENKARAVQLIADLKLILSHPLNRGKPLSTLARFAAWQIASRLRAEIEFEWMEGAKLIVNRGMTGATGNIYCGLHEFVEMAFLLHFLRANDLFLDIGANIGSYTILAAAVCGARAIAFEPDPDTARALRRNIAINHLSALAEVREVALGAVEGRTGFTVGLGPGNRVAAPNDKWVQDVPIRRLDDIPGVETPTLIKMDVEGFEEQVLSGASRVFALPSLLAIQSELCTPRVQHVLGTFGFEQRFYDPFTRTLPLTPCGFRTANALFIRDTESVAKRLSRAPLRIVNGKAF